MGLSTVLSASVNCAKSSVSRELVYYCAFLFLWLKRPFLELLGRCLGILNLPSGERVFSVSIFAWFVNQVKTLLVTFKSYQSSSQESLLYRSCSLPTTDIISKAIVSLYSSSSKILAKSTEHDPMALYQYLCSWLPAYLEIQSEYSIRFLKPPEVVWPLPSDAKLIIK